MKLDARPYKDSLNKCSNYLLKNNCGNIIQTIAELSIYSGIPIVAVTLYAIELFGETEELTVSRDKLIAFYDYEEVLWN